MQLSEKIVTPEDLLKVEDVEHSAFMKECEVLFGPLSDDTFWKYREHLRSTYLYTGINIKGKPFHFVHLNKKDPNLIAFTANDKVGKKDGKTYIKPGKYLAQYSNLDNEQIKTIVTNYKHEFVPPKIHYAKSANECVNIYENGPSSCMNGKGWDKTEHPARIYFGPNTKLAYLKNKRGDGFSARCVVRTDTTPNEYIRIYGDKDLMQKAFKAAGIMPASKGLQGCVFPMLWFENKEQKRLLMPYMDGGVSTAYASKNREGREFMTVGKLPKSYGEMYWELSTTPTSGFVNMPDVTQCNHCNELEFKDKIIIIRGIHYCKKCLIQLKTVIIDKDYQALTKHMLLKDAHHYSNLYFEIDDKWYSRQGLTMIDKFYDKSSCKIIPLEETDICEYSGDRYMKKDMLVMHSTPEGTTCFRRHNKGNLLDNGLTIDPKTYEFYNRQETKRLVDEGNTHLKSVHDFLDEMLADMKAAKHLDTRYIPDIIDTMDVSNGVKEFLMLYGKYVNDDSYQL